MSDADWGAVWFTLIVLSLVLYAVYRRAAYPKRWCSCRGGKRFAPGGGRWRDCRRCGGSGVRGR